MQHDRSASDCEKLKLIVDLYWLSNLICRTHYYLYSIEVLRYMNLSKSLSTWRWEIFIWLSDLNIDFGIQKRYTDIRIVESAAVVVSIRNWKRRKTWPFDSAAIKAKQDPALILSPPTMIDLNILLQAQALHWCQNCFKHQLLDNLYSCIKQLKECSALGVRSLY